MTHSEAVAALEEAELQAHLDRRDEAAADDGGRREAELAEWQRIVQLLAATGGPYDPDTDAVVQEELAEDRRREEAEQQRRQEQQRVADRAEELARLGGAGRLDRSVPSQAGDEAARDLLDENRDYRAAKVDAWLARALADQSGHYADPAARAAAVGLLPVPVRATRTRCSPLLPVRAHRSTATSSSSSARPGRPGRHERARRVARQRGRGEGRYGVSAADEVVVATWSEHSEIGHHYEDLLADGRVIAWTEPPFGESLYPGDDDPDYNPICHCPLTPRQFCMEGAGCNAPCNTGCNTRGARARVAGLTCGNAPYPSVNAPCCTVRCTRSADHASGGVTLTEGERDTDCHAHPEKCHATLNTSPYVRFRWPGGPSGVLCQRTLATCHRTLTDAISCQRRLIALVRDVQDGRASYRPRPFRRAKPDCRASSAHS